LVVDVLQNCAICSVVNSAELQYSRLVRTWKGTRSEVEAAAALGVAPNTLSYWIDGTYLPPTTRIPFLATALGMTVEALTEVIAQDRAARAARPLAAVDAAPAAQPSAIVKREVIKRPVHASDSTKPGAA
jgi:hypothetical protein